MTPAKVIERRNFGPFSAPHATIHNDRDDARDHANGLRALRSGSARFVGVKVQERAIKSNNLEIVVYVVTARCIDTEKAKAAGVNVVEGVTL